MMSEVICVLYVDDEPDLLGIGKLFLERSGNFTVTTSQSASEAIRFLERKKFDVIISDYQMPVMNGIQFLVEVRSRFGPIPFILFTGRGREEVVIQAINSGADFYLQRNTDPGAQFAELSHKIKQIAFRKFAEDALWKNVEKYKRVIEHTDEAIIVEQDGMMMLVNPRAVELTGYSEKELLSMPFSAIIHSDDRSKVMEDYKTWMKNEDSVSRFSFRLSSKDGSTPWVKIGSAEIDWNGRAATLNFLTDITERKELEMEMEYHEQELVRYSMSLDAANKKIMCLSSITRHDILNMITAIVMYLSLAEEMVKDPVAREYLLKIDRIAQLIQKQIQYTRDYQSIGANSPVWQDCRILVDSAAKEALLGKITVRTDLPASAEVFADPLIVKVFYNLMNNSARYGGKITTIRFSAEERDGVHIMVCEDDGEGVPLEEKEKIFERGFGKNTGLGLALSREILDITGITIKETGEPGKGARFEMTVPKEAWRTTGMTDGHQIIQVSK